MQLLSTPNCSENARPAAGFPHGDHLTCGLYKMAAAMAAPDLATKPVEEVSPDLAQYLREHDELFRQRNAVSDALGELEDLPPSKIDKAAFDRLEKAWKSLNDRECAMERVIALHPCRNAADVGAKVRFAFRVIDDNSLFNMEEFAQTVLRSMIDLGLPDAVKA